MLTRVEAEKDNPQATLMFGGSTDNYIAAVDKGLLEAYQSPSTYLDPTGTWNPIYVGCIAFACNSDWFKEKGLEYPTSWEDLLKPEFKGEIIMAHPATSGTAYTVLATLVQLKGDDQVWMTSEAGQGCYAENDSFRVPTNTAAPVADGLVTLDEVPVIDYDAVWAASVKSEYCEQFENKIATKPEG